VRAWGSLFLALCAIAPLIVALQTRDQKPIDRVAHDDDEVTPR
jgi:hypothetical protein